MFAHSAVAAVSDRRLEFLHLCDGKDGLREDAEREFPSLAPLGERVDRIRRPHQPWRDG